MLIDTCHLVVTSSYLFNVSHLYLTFNVNIYKIKLFSNFF